VKKKMRRENDHRRKKTNKEMTFSISIQSGIHVLLNQDVQVSPSFKIENFIYKVWEDKA